jgi:hypothetical protein
MVKAVSVAGAAPTVKGTVAVADCGDELESTAETPKEKLPLVVGVPEMIPVVDVRVSPAGSCPDAMLHV